MIKPGLSRRDAQQLSREILHTAHTLFAERGVEAVSMHQIAKCAGIGQGTLYRRYSNKSDLCMDLIKENFNQFSQALDSRLLQMVDRPPSERLCEIIRSLFVFFDSESHWMEAINVPPKEVHSKAQFFQSPPYLYMHDRITSLLAEAVGQQGANLDPSLTAHLLISSLSPHMYMHLRDSRGYTPEQAAEHVGASFILPLCCGLAGRAEA